MVTFFKFVDLAEDIRYNLAGKLQKNEGARDSIANVNKKTPGMSPGL